VSIEFALVDKRTSIGIVSDAIIPVQVLYEFGYQTLQFILDTGADFSMLPRHMADLMGIDLSECEQGVSYGIEGEGLNVYASRIQIKIGNVELKIRCLFLENENTPYISGRADIFANFNITFDNKNKKILFSKITT